MWYIFKSPWTHDKCYLATIWNYDVTSNVDIQTILRVLTSSFNLDSSGQVRKKLTYFFFSRLPCRNKDKKYLLVFPCISRIFSLSTVKENQNFFMTAASAIFLLFRLSDGSAIFCLVYLCKWCTILQLKPFVVLDVVSEKLIGVQSNHSVEYFGGPAVPTHWFLYNQRFLHNQHVFWWLPPALAGGGASEQSELCSTLL